MLKSGDELFRDLAEQLRFLRVSATLYDQGRKAEAKRLATPISSILVDRGRSKSILSALGWIDSFQMFATPSTQMGNSISFIAHLSVGNPPHFTLANANPLDFKRMSVTDWLNQEVYRVKDERLSRRDLILTVRDRDGGSHVEPHEIGGSYAALAKGSSIGLTWALAEDGSRIIKAGDQPFYFVDSPPLPGAMPPPAAGEFQALVGGHFASLRQIAEEVALSFAVTGFFEGGVGDA